MIAHFPDGKTGRGELNHEMLKVRNHERKRFRVFILSCFRDPLPRPWNRINRLSASLCLTIHKISRWGLACGFSRPSVRCSPARWQAKWLAPRGVFASLHPTNAAPKREEGIFKREVGTPKREDGSGHNNVAMSDLCALLADLGFGRVMSLLQSGNLVIESDRQAGAALERLLEKATAERLGVCVDYVVRSADEPEKLSPATHSSKKRRTPRAIFSSRFSIWARRGSRASRAACHPAPAGGCGARSGRRRKRPPSTSGRGTRTATWATCSARSP